MKKKLLLLVAVIALLFPVVVNASKSTLDSVKSMDLKDTFKEEGIEISDSKYQETDDQVVVYMFSGNGCGYCRAFLNYINSILPEKGKMFKLRTFEVWYDKKNNKLLSEVAEFLDEEAGGVPYIIIGEKVFPGYVSDWDADIVAAIEEEYAKNPKDRYDVFVELDKTKASDTGAIETKKIIYWTVGSVIIATLIVVLTQLITTGTLNKRIDAIYDNLGIERKLTNKEVKELDTEEKPKKTRKRK
jgi:thiol-disulfide isomerase/thioredoxin